jgi:hypothetical protein
LSYGTEIGADAPQLSVTDLDTICEWEAIGKVTFVSTKLYQNEVAWTGAFKDVIHKRIQISLDHEKVGASLMVLDHKNVSTTNPTPYVSKAFTAFSALGQECWRRAAHELEHRHTMTGGCVHDQDLANGLLDLRTKNTHHMSAEEFSSAKKTLEEEYLAYSKQYSEYMTESNEAQNPDVAVTQPQPPVPVPVEPIDIASEPPSMFCIGANPHAQPTPSQPMHTLAMQRANFEKYLEAWLALDIDWMSNFPELKQLGKTNMQPVRPAFRLTASEHV